MGSREFDPLMVAADWNDSESIARNVATAAVNHYRAALRSDEARERVKKALDDTWMRLLRREEEVPSITDSVIDALLGAGGGGE